MSDESLNLISIKIFGKRKENDLLFKSRYGKKKHYAFNILTYKLKLKTLVSCVPKSKIRLTIWVCYLG